MSYFFVSNQQTKKKSEQVCYKKNFSILKFRKKNVLVCDIFNTINKVC